MASESISEERLEARSLQDAKWADAKIDARGHVSNKEFAVKNAAYIKHAIADFNRIEVLVSLMMNEPLSDIEADKEAVDKDGNSKRLILGENFAESSESSNLSHFRKITPDILKLVLDYVHRPAYGALLYSSLLRREKVRAYIETNKTPNYKNKQVEAASIESIRKDGISSKSCEVNDLFKIYIRKRPLFDFEVSSGYYDVTSISGGSKCLHIHDGKMARSRRLIVMSHRAYIADHVFGPLGLDDIIKTTCLGDKNSDEDARIDGVGGQSTDAAACGSHVSDVQKSDSHMKNRESAEIEFCSRVLDPLLKSAIDGVKSTLLCFGQTGTGKTHTLRSALHYVCNNLPTGFMVSISFIEIKGSKVYDLFNNKHVVHLRDDEHGETHVRGAKWTLLSGGDSSAVFSAVNVGLLMRFSKATERNPASSRSHAVCTMKLFKPSDSSSSSSSSSSSLNQPNKNGVVIQKSATSASSDDSAEGFSLAGTITFVDLAGSEKSSDTYKMSASMHKESADINSALMALKDCFRAYHKAVGTSAPRTSQAQGASFSSSSASEQVHIPFRASLLTRILKHCFVQSTCKADNLRLHKTTIVATVSPSVLDTEHTLNTLDHVIPISPVLNSYTQEWDRWNVDSTSSEAYSYYISRESLLSTMSPTMRTTSVNRIYGKSHPNSQLDKSVSSLSSDNISNFRLTQSYPVTEDTVEVFFTDLDSHGKCLSYDYTPVKDWTNEQLQAFISVCANGKFKDIIIPSDLTGKMLLDLDISSWTKLFAGVQRVARSDAEGSFWTLEADNPASMAAMLQSFMLREQSLIERRLKLRAQQGAYNGSKNSINNGFSGNSNNISNVTSNSNSIKSSGNDINESIESLGSNNEPKKGGTITLREFLRQRSGNGPESRSSGSGGNRIENSDFVAEENTTDAPEAIYDSEEDPH